VLLMKKDVERGSKGSAREGTSDRKKRMGSPNSNAPDRAENQLALPGSGSGGKTRDHASSGFLESEKDDESAQR